MLKAMGIFLLSAGTAGFIRYLLLQQQRHLGGLRMMYASLLRMEQAVRCIGTPAEYLLEKEADLVSAPLSDYYLRLGQCIRQREREDWHQVLQEVIELRDDGTFRREELELLSETLNALFVREQPGTMDACQGYFDAIRQKISEDSAARKDREKVTVSVSVAAAALLLLLLL